MENDIGIVVNYTVLGITNDEDKKYVVYTNYLPSDNELGVRLFAGLITDEKNFKVERLSKTLENKITEEFKLEIIKSGKKIRRVKN